MFFSQAAGTLAWAKPEWPISVELERGVLLGLRETLFQDKLLLLPLRSGLLWDDCAGPPPGSPPDSLAGNSGIEAEWQEGP